MYRMRWNVTSKNSQRMLAATGGKIERTSGVRIGGWKLDMCEVVLVLHVVAIEAHSER